MIEKTKNLETERKNLLIEIGKLKKTANTEATTLEKKLLNCTKLSRLKSFWGKKPSATQLKSVNLINSKPLSKKTAQSQVKQNKNQYR